MIYSVIGIEGERVLKGLLTNLSTLHHTYDILSMQFKILPNHMQAQKTMQTPHGKAPEWFELKT